LKNSNISFIEKSIRIALSIVGFPFSIAQLIYSRSESSKYKPIGNIVHINSHRIHAIVSGQGTPTVILESGMGGCSLDWSLVQPQISDLATVLSYDRAGFGWSTSSHEQQTCKEYVEDLRQVLSKLNLKPPYILVGHSYGGLIMRLFASVFSSEVAGLILVDSAHESRYLPEHMDEKRQQQRNKALKLNRLGYLLSPLGLPRLVKSFFVGSKRLPSKQQGIVKALGYRAKAYKAMYLELKSTLESGRQLQRANQLPSQLPVIILTAGKQDEDWKEQQNLMLGLTNNSKQIVVEDSWHAIQIHKPEIIIKSIREMVETL
jgi:pimeloyl-ACP methyl ester carboxylesterase